MTAVVFETPGLIDVRAFTIMGAHAKPNSANPIGFFGTGLKYAIAVLVRLGAEPVVWIGRDRFSFTKVVSTFRGAPLETIKMTVLKDGQTRRRSYELPYTTAYGKAWEVWQAFRELESNTRDEGGRAYLIDAPEKWDLFHGGPEADKTYIVVDLPAFVEAAEKIDEVFLPRGRRGAPGVILEAFDGPSGRIYYRTMRAMDLKKPSTFTYNVLERLDLTEDRTIKYEFYAKQAVARWVLSAATVDQVEAVLKAGEDAWEHDLEFPAYVAPSPAFEEVMRERRKGLSRNAWSYYGAYSPRRRTVRVDAPWAIFDEHPRPWKVEGLEVVDAAGNAVFAAPEGYYDEWARTAEAIITRIRVTSST